ncbi:MAG: CotH kinase family protein [Lachnospiraceae bacterium]|nr:CotH kinase family protein [Lachnospiraceae bacterium]
MTDTENAGQLNLNRQMNKEKNNINLISPFFFMLAWLVLFTAAAYADEERPANGIPVLCFNIDETKGSIEAMNNSPDHSVRCCGSIDIIVPEGYTCEYCADPESVKELELAYIRGRGNSTWVLDKKPYTFKLKESASILGMDKGKKWVLLANALDSTLIRSRISYELGAKLGLEYTVKCLPVDLVMNGKYLGSYLLTEAVTVAKNRVDIDELDETDNDEDLITGGYLLSVGGQKKDEKEEAKIYLNYEKFLVVDSPEFEDGVYENPAQKEYITNYMHSLEEQLLADTINGFENAFYGEYFDIDSAIKFWWINEITENLDAYQTRSSYAYKKRNDKLYSGPIWDYDICYSKMNDPDTWGFTDPLFWYKCMMIDPANTEKIKECWSSLSAYLYDVIKEGGLLDSYKQEIKRSWLADYELWNSNTVTGPEDTGEQFKDPEEIIEVEFELLRNWIAARKKMYDDNIERITDIYHYVIFKDSDEVVAVYYPVDGAGISVLPGVPAKEGSFFMGWKNDAGEYADLTEGVHENMILYADYADIDIVSKGQELYFLNDVWYEPFFEGTDTEYDIVYRVYPEEATDKNVRWTSSDTSVASVTEDGKILINSTGETVITGILDSGETASQRLIVYKRTDEMSDADVERVFTDKTSIELAIGEHKHINVWAEPFYCEFASGFESESPETASVDDFGVVTAVSLGTTRIRVYDMWQGVSTYCEVTVLAEKKDDEAIDTEPSDVEPDDISLPTGDSFRGGILFMLLSLSVLLRRLGKWKKQ